MKKMICLLLVLSLFLVTFCVPVAYAFETAIGTGTGTESDEDPSDDSDENIVPAAAKIKGAGTNIVNAILWFGYAIALGMIVIIGIKYILGSAEAKSNMKSAIVNWIIGAFIVFMCTTIATWVLNLVILDGDNKDGGGLADKIINAAGEGR